MLSVRTRRGFRKASQIDPLHSRQPDLVWIKVTQRSFLDLPGQFLWPKWICKQHPYIYSLAWQKAPQSTNWAHRRRDRGPFLQSVPRSHIYLIGFHPQLEPI